MDCGRSRELLETHTSSDLPAVMEVYYVRVYQRDP